MNTEKQTLKQRLIITCKQAIDTRITLVKNRINSLEHTLYTDTKSSAGDKHETSRAMLQLKREQLGQQLATIEAELQLLQTVKSTQNSTKIGLGSIVYTSQYNYFIAISCGLLKLDHQEFYAISLQTPMAQLLKGNTKNSLITFKGNTFKILKLE